MSKVKHKIPQLAITASNLLQQKFNGEMGEISKQVIAQLGLREEDHWTVDFTTGFVVPSARAPQLAKAPQEPVNPAARKKR